ncbi:hypothetical protein [Paralysiella testudinis]|uniref:Lipoprotein n=1 Tax=Paralysiella testudinis TaxID=2809020 RepID=A0A892ZM54_9NEIS|nr:hypothetical protein [Paralysiella testudinis]QRQ82766.1 hypothetical protein JQU52_05120 [Paralysiella testudinis]
MKNILIPALLSLTITGCGALQKHHGINWHSPSPCPAPTAEQVDSSGRLSIQKGTVYKCQIQPYVSNMACVGITDADHADGVLCQNGEGASILFLFDQNGALKKHISNPTNPKRSSQP